MVNFRFKNIVSMIEDLKYINKTVILWNWPTKMKSMILRFDDKLTQVFQDSENFDELFRKNDAEMNVVVNMTHL